MTAAVLVVTTEAVAVDVAVTVAAADALAVAVAVTVAVCSRRYGHCSGLCVRHCGRCLVLTAWPP